MVDPRLLAPESACSMELENGSNVLIAAHARDYNVGMGIVSGPFSDPLGQYRISYLLDALHRALMLSGKDRADQASVRLMFSTPDTIGVRCLIMCVEESKTAVIVAHRSAEYDNAGGEE